MDDARYPFLHIRLYLGPGRWLGPGKADLLALIAETGSIAAAGRRMGMSYKRAWSLVEAMNAMARTPLVESSRGGAQGGGAGLTPEGAEVMARYQRLLAVAEAASRDEAAALAALLPGPGD